MTAAVAERLDCGMGRGTRRKGNTQPSLPCRLGPSNPRTLGPSGPARRLRSQSGNALVTVLIMIGTLTPLGAFAVMQARLDLVAHERIRAAVEAFYAAESGLEAALFDLNQSPELERLRNGPDGAAGTADDHLFPFRVPPPSPAADPTQRYQVRVEPLDGDTFDVIAEGFAFGNASHGLAARVKGGAPFVPGAICAGASAVTVVAGEDLNVSGFDRAGRDGAQPALALASEDAAAAARSALANAADRWRGSGGAPSVEVRDALDVEALAAAFENEAGAAGIGAAPSGPLGSGILVSAGSVEVAEASGAGALIVNGNLRVTGELTFSGLVLVLGDVRLEAGSTVHIDGALLQGPGRGLLELLAGGEVSYDSRAIDAVESLLPGRLPRRAIVVGWRDLS
jgi:hypothetical protein